MARNLDVFDFTSQIYCKVALRKGHGSTPERVGGSDWLLDAWSDQISANGTALTASKTGSVDRQWCARLPRMPLILILVILLLVFGGGGYYMGPGVGYYGGGGISLILLLVVLYLLFGRGRGRL